MWSATPFENIAEIISDMHLALVERLAPTEGEHWLDLGCGPATSPSTQRGQVRS